MVNCASVLSSSFQLLFYLYHSFCLFLYIFWKKNLTFAILAMQRMVLTQGSLPTKIVCLTEVVTVDELKDDEEYEYIMEDMRTEGAKYGEHH
jgi:hypothetical protein